MYKLFFTLLCCGLFMSASAQISENPSILDELGVFATVQSNLITANNAPIPVVNMGNTVFLEQIGLNNTANIQVTSSQSNVEVRQNGSDNFVDLNYTSSLVSSLVVQNGQNNSVVDFEFNPQGVVNTSVTQNGNDLHVQKNGSNSISNGLQINMTGTSKTITINSF